MGTSRESALRRRLNLPLLVLYGTGVTVGAGIYVLIGTVAGRAGVYAPWSFLLAAVVMGLTVGSYAELVIRFPVSAGEAAYVKAAFKSRLLSTSTGLLTIAVGVISSATVSLGSAGYIRQFVDLPPGIIVIAVVVALVHCTYGYFASGGPAGVGQAAGRALRTAILAVGVLDVLLTFALWGLVPEIPGMGV